MIVNSTTTQVHRTGEMSEKSFTIKPTKKIIKLLTSGLYSNPVRAAQVENSQNAWDSHVRAGKADVPFAVHLPNTFEPFYSIRDFGTGMSHDFMMKDYTKVGESTKDKDASQAGGWGVGRMASYAISDAYTVICFDGKMRREYSVYMNEDGFPSIALLVEDKDNSERGVEVKFPVPREMHSQFQQEAGETVYRFYKVRPTISGGNGWQGFEDVEYNMKADDGVWAFTKREGQSTAVMGVYHFPIDANAINKISDEERDLVNSGVVLHVPMGSLETTSSREALNYTEHTNKTLRDLLKRAQKDLTVYVQKEFDKVANVFEAKQLYYDYFKHGGIANKIGRILGEKPKIKFNGETIDNAELELTDGTTCYFFSKTYKRGNRVVVKNEYQSSILLNRKSVHVFESDSRYGSRVKHFTRELGNDGHHYDAVSFVLIFKDKAAKDLFYKANQLEAAFELTKTSSLPKAPRMTGGGKRIITIFSFNEGYAKKNGRCYRGYESNYFNEEVVENEDAENDVEDVAADFDDIEDVSPVYILIERFKTHHFGSDFLKLAECLSFLRKQDKNFPKTLYAIRPSSKEEAKKAGWIELKDMARPIFEEYFKNNLAIEPLQLNEFSDFENKNLGYLIPGLDEAKKRSEEIEKHNEEFDVIEDMSVYLFGSTITIPARKKEDVMKNLRQIRKDLKAKYPLLDKMLPNWHFDLKEIQHYIALEDIVMK